MHDLQQLLANNQRWARQRVEDDPHFFKSLSEQQSPEYLWIGCSDSRVPANQIIDLPPGEVFVHRNIANQVVHTDFNCLSVLQFAVDVLKVRHILVVGHYGCSGVRAALQGQRLGISDNWLRHVKDVRHKHIHRLSALPDQTQCVDKLCEYNVVEQVMNVCHSTIVQDAWEAGQSLHIHGWVYSLEDGLVRDLGISIDGPDAIMSRYEYALKRLAN